ncbi:MAG: PepSY domain-containing protein [Leucobacter sp.]
MSDEQHPRSIALRLSTAVAAAGAALLLLASCASQPQSEPATDSPTTQAPTDEADAAEDADGADDADDPDGSVADDETPDGRINAAAAVDAALQAVPGDVVELGLERERTSIVWEVGVLGADGSGTEVLIDSKSGEVVKQERLRLDSAQRTAPAVTAADAIGIALDTADGRVKAMDLDTERGAVVWEVEVIGTGGGTEIYIDATSGDVVKQERM